MIQACLNGGCGAPAPATPDDIACAARAAVDAGAEALHIHPRGADGAESLAPEDVSSCLLRVRAAVPGIPIGLGTGAWIAPGGRARHALMRAWTELPDYVSVNLCEEDAPEVMRLMQQMGIGIEAGLWSKADAIRFVEENLPPVLRVLIEMPDVAPEDAAAEAETILRMLPNGLPMLLHGMGRSTWGMVNMAFARGLDTRIGFEDTVQMPDGTQAPDNAALVWAVRELGNAQ